MKCLFTDLDGTFLNDEKLVPEKNRKAVEKMLEAGHKVIIATGRALPSAVAQATRLGLNKQGCYCIAYNGAQVYDLGAGKSLYHKTVPVECAREAYHICKQAGLHIQTYDDEQVLTPYDDDEVVEYCRRVAMTYRVIPEVFETLKEAPAKVLVIDFADTGKLCRVQEEINRMGGNLIDTYFSCPELLEIVGHGVSKGEALEFLCNYLNVALEDTIGCGDAENDISMIERAGIGVCMCNGDPKVKERADYITTLNNNQGGVAEVIDRFILEA